MATITGSEAFIVLATVLAGGLEYFKDGNAQEIWTILRKYRSKSW